MTKTLVPAQGISSYDQVPFFRKRWFAVVSILFFAPAVIAIAATGNLYALTRNRVHVYTSRGKTGVILSAAFLMIMGLLRFTA